MQRWKERFDRTREKIVEIQKLGGDITELQKPKLKLLRSLSATLPRVPSVYQRTMLTACRDTKELLKKDEEIEKLQSVNKELSVKTGY